MNLAMDLFSHWFQISVYRAVVRSASKGPLVQRGLSNRPLEADLTGGLSLFAIPPTKIKDFGHLPLHKGGSRCALHLHDKLQVFLHVRIFFISLSSSAPWLAFYGNTPASLAYPDKTMYGLLADTAKQYPGHTAYVFQGKKTNYADFLQRIESAAQGLYHLEFYAVPFIFILSIQSHSHQ